MQFNDILTQRFYNSESIVFSNKEELLTRIREAYESYVNAIKTYERLQSTNYDSITQDQILKTKTRFPFLDLSRSELLSANNNELTISITDMPVLVNLKYPVYAHPSHTPTELTMLKEKYQDLDVDTVLFITLPMYSFDTSFSTTRITMQHRSHIEFTWLKNLVSFKHRNSNSSSSGIEDLFYEQYLKETVLPLFRINQAHPGKHSHVNNDGSGDITGRICYGTHAFYNNYRQFLDNPSAIDPSQIMNGFLANFLSWAMHVTINDNYGGSFLNHYNEHSTTENRSYVSELIREMSEAQNLRILVDLLKIFKQPQEAPRDTLEKFLQLPTHKGTNTPIFNTPVLTTMFMYEVAKGYDTILPYPAIFVKLFALLLYLFKRHNPHMTETMLCILKESMEYMPLEITRMKYSQQMLEHIRRLPAQWLALLYANYSKEAIRRSEDLNQFINYLKEIEEA